MSSRMTTSSNLTSIIQICATTQDSCVDFPLTLILTDSAYSTFLDQTSFRNGYQTTFNLISVSQAFFYNKHEAFVIDSLIIKNDNFILHITEDFSKDTINTNRITFFGSLADGTLDSTRCFN
jgi:hypothetical protein